MFEEIPLIRPDTPLLDRVEKPADLRQFKESQLEQLCAELRHFLLYTVGQTGGHFGAGLGVIELTVALHYVFNTPHDRLVWDVGHQTYPHKILTERRQRMHTLRQKDGIGPFPSRRESDYDTFGVGHSSTAISAALGMATAATMNGDERKIVAIVGDGAMTAGMAFEALNHVTDTEANLLVILNDNAMSISRSAGGLAKYFARILASRLYLTWREGSRQILSRIPKAWELARRTEEHVKGMVVPGTLFDELGFNYMGPFDGHDVKTLVQVFNNIKDLKGPQFMHMVTQKGKGYRPAELAPEGSHNLSKIEPKRGLRPARAAPKKASYSNVFADWICDMAAIDPKLIAITPAMQEGSDLTRFAQQFPERYYDVAIAEQHALTFAAGLACEGAKPVVAIYSTFLQRAYDQLIHDVSLQKLNVLLAIDRAGLLEDGPTHSGSFDLSFLRCVPNLIIMAPSDENESRQMLYTGFCHDGPAAVRYPRGAGPGKPVTAKMTAIPIGQGVVRREGSQVAILAFGSMLSPALAAAQNLHATVVDMRFVKPLDEALIAQIAERHNMLVTIEENSVKGGAGSGVNEYLAESALTIPILNLGIPDHFVQHGRQEGMLADCGLNEEGITASISKRLAFLGLPTAVTR